MKAWRLDRLGGTLSFKDIAMPEVRPGSVLVRIEASTLMSYQKALLEAIPRWRAPLTLRWRYPRLALIFWRSESPFRTLRPTESRFAAQLNALLRQAQPRRRFQKTIVEIRKQSEIPIILFSYFNPIFQYAFERFESEAATAGADGLLVVLSIVPRSENPDLVPK
jgi:hypothetical protein